MSVTVSRLSRTLTALSHPVWPPHISPCYDLMCPAVSGPFSTLTSASIIHAQAHDLAMQSGRPRMYTLLQGNGFSPSLLHPHCPSPAAATNAEELREATSGQSSVTTLCTRRSILSQSSQFIKQSMQEEHAVSSESDWAQ